MTATDIDLKSASNLRFSGHETFACRYAWLPKAYRALNANPGQFSDEDGAMVELGLGKNMVRSLRFRTENVGLAVPDGQRSFVLTEFAHSIFATNGSTRTSKMSAPSGSSTGNSRRAMTARSSPGATCSTIGLIRNLRNPKPSRRSRASPSIAPSP
jgi:hypothetical protein